MSRFSKLLTVFTVSLFAVGCEESDENRNRLSGNVILDGQPVAAGQVLITPDTAKGNSGPQGLAAIVDGRYDTAAESRESGPPSGPVTIQVTGLENGYLTFDYQFDTDLPAHDHVLDITIPASAKVAPPKPGSPSAAMP